MITNPFYILIVFLGLIAAALTLGARSKIAGKVSPVIWILVFSALAANLRLIPTAHPFYGGLSGYAVPFAVCLLLLQIRFSQIRGAGWPVLKAFGAACIASLVGCLVAGLALHTALDAVLAGQGWKLTGPYIGTYIGGSINFFSLWEGLEIDNPHLFAAANAVDNMVLLPIFVFWMAAPRLLQKWYPPRAAEMAPVAQDAPAAERLCLYDIIVLVFVALGVTAAGELIKKYLFGGWFPQLPSILIVTTLALLLGQSKAVRRLQGAKPLGDFAFYLFFAAVGAMMDIPKAIGLAPVLFAYVAIAIVCHIFFALAAARLLRIDLYVMAVASLAAKAGPSTVAAYTSAAGVHALTVPGVGAALLGYAIGNYAGLAGAYLLKLLLS